MIEKKNLIDRLKYSEKWNSPVPKWVYRLIESMPEEGEENVPGVNSGRGNSDRDCDRGRDRQEVNIWQKLEDALNAEYPELGIKLL